jgi:hypothetical protein
MAKRKKQALARKGTVSKRGKAHAKKVSSASRKAATHTGAKARAKKAARRVAVKTKAKKLGIKRRARQAAPKKVSPRRTEPSRQAAEATEETFIVDIIEEPVPGVVLVTELESARTSGLEVPSPEPESGESPDLA